MDDGGLDQEVDLAGQVALITGGGRGIGRAMSIALAEAGAAVAVLARTVDQLAETVGLIEEKGGTGLAVPADVTDRRAIEGAVHQTEQQLGPVDLLVANAAAAAPIGPSWQADADAWWYCMDVNLRGPFLCARAVLPGMVRRQRGRIVITGSNAGLRPMRYGSAYGVSKCAVIRLAEMLAVETQEHGISVFALYPGFVRTALTTAAAASPEDEQWLGGAFRRGLAEGRDVPPEHAARLVAVLASGRADSLSGCYVSIQDDVAEMVQRADEIRQDELYRLRLRT